MKEFAAIILAAGESKRMGQPKMLLPFREKTVIENIAEQALASSAERVVVVTGCYHNKIEILLQSIDAVICRNLDYQQGMLSSVRCGIASLGDEFAAAVIIPGDNILITSGIINNVVKGWRLGGKGMAVPVFEGRRGHPLILSGKYFNAVMNMPDVDGLRGLLRMYPEDVSEIKMDSDSILRDIDTYEEYLKEINQI